VQVLGEVPAELRLTPERDARLAAQAAALGRTDVVRLLDLLSDALEALASGAQARIQLELALVKAAAPEVDPSARALLARIDRLETQLAGGAPTAPPAVAAGPAQVPAAEQAPPAPSGPSSPVAQSTAASAPTSAAVPTAAPAASAAPAAAEPVPAEATPAPVEAAPAAPEAATSPAPVANGVPSGLAPMTAAAVAAAAPLPAASPEPAPVTPTPSVSPVPPGELDLAALRELWPAVVDAVRAENGLLGAALEKAQPVEVGGGEATFAFAREESFFKGTAERDEHRQRVAETMRSLSGTALRPRYELRDLAAAEPTEAPAAVTTPTDDDLVDRFVAEFDAEELIDDEGGA
jgi:DNA polymerase-3 subunit gamma/tau